MGMLRDFDSSISQNDKGSVIWEVVSLAQNSPPLIGVSPSPRRGAFDHSDAVESQIIASTLEITDTGQRNKLFSDSALMRLEKLAVKTKTLGPHSIFLNGNSLVKREAVITETTLKNIQEFTSPKYSSFGSITGDLESITVHNASEFRVWDELTGKPVRCKFEVEQDQMVKDLLRKRVTVSGEILSNSAGMPISLKLMTLAPAADHALPTIEEMRGLIKDFTEGRPLKEYMEEIADE